MMNMFKPGRIGGRREGGKAQAPLKPRRPGVNMPQQVAYVSLPVDVPSGFLSLEEPPEDAKPITVTPIDFAQTPVPEYAGLYAVVLDNVISPTECAELIRLAESSVPPALEEGGADAEGEDGSEGPGAPKQSPWRPAAVNIGPGLEIMQTDYRNSDRIIWDQQEVVDRIWARIRSGAPEVAKELATVKQDQLVLGGGHWQEQAWSFKEVNKRMRFLRYNKGQFFRPHCDGSYEVQGLPPGQRIRTIFTLHLYLNDSVDGVEGEEKDTAPELVGGSTPFLSNDEKRRVDVHPKAGRVLIFQHRRLLHSGDDVVKGTKFTMRSDILYELTKDEDGY